MKKEVQKAVQILKEGGIVIFPTDTAFGIGCRVSDKKAVQKLFNIRRRPQTKSVPVLVDTVKMAKEY
ncbi:MAG: Sua5/YciO/YrdC/YwlC family protein, partial [bacterium]|nr:Sua5/YciO/YrdC/YwlC family protein [bacterium]